MPSHQQRREERFRPTTTEAVVWFRWAEDTDPRYGALGEDRVTREARRYFVLGLRRGGMTDRAIAAQLGVTLQQLNDFML